MHIRERTHTAHHGLCVWFEINDRLGLVSEVSTVFLSPSSFVNPFEHLSEKETKRSIQSYLAYLKDDTRLITNPGLKVIGCGGDGGSTFCYQSLF